MSFNGRSNSNGHPPRYERRGNPGALFLTAHRRTGAVSTLGAGSNLTDPHIHPKMTRLSVMVTLMPVPKNEGPAGQTRRDLSSDASELGRFRKTCSRLRFPKWSIGHGETGLLRVSGTAGWGMPRRSIERPGMGRKLAGRFRSATCLCRETADFPMSRMSPLLRQADRWK